MKQIYLFMIVSLSLCGFVQCGLLDTKYPKVVSSDPYPGEMDVPSNRKITVTFNRDMDSQRCIAAFSIQPNPGGVFQYANKQLIFTPSKEWEMGMTYVFSIDQRCEDKDGVDLKDPYIASFATGTDFTPPSLEKGNEMSGDENPACGGAGTTLLTDFKTDICYTKEGLKLRFNFSEDMDQANTTSAFAISPKVDGTIIWPSGSCMIFVPKEDLQRDTLYRIEIDSRAKDLNNNKLAESFVRYFTTSGDRDLPAATGISSDLATSGDGCNGNVSDVLPTNDIADVCTDKNGTGKGAVFRIDFSKIMEPSFTKAAFSISPNVSGVLTMTNNNQQLLFTASETLAPETEYKISVANTALDVSNNALKEQFIRFFKTNALMGYPVVSSIAVKTGGVYPACGGTDSDILSNSVINACMGDPSVNPIAVTFSEPMTRSAAEDAFTLSPSVTGSFSWNSTSTVMTFTPTTAFIYGQLYTVGISTTAVDLQKQAMQTKVNGSFSVVTNQTNLAPTVSSITIKTGEVYPTCGGITTDILTSTVVNACEGNPDINPIVVTFSEAMKTAETEDAFSITPSADGYFSWNSTKTEMTFYPAKKLSYGKSYAVEISTLAEDIHNLTLKQKVKSSFYVGAEDHLSPSAEAISVNFEKTGDADGASTPPNDITATNKSSITTNNTIALNIPIQVDFPEPVNKENAVSAIVLSPSTYLNYYWASPTSLQITPVNGFTGNTTYQLTISPSLTDLAGNSLDSTFMLTFKTEDVSPIVAAIGVESQGVDWEVAGEQKKGSTTPRDYAPGSTCWWDYSKDILSASNYTMRGGENPLAPACADSNTDNIVLVFNKPMDAISTLNAISLQRITGESSSVAVADWSWSASKKVLHLKVVESRAVGAAGCGSTVNYIGNETNLVHENSLYRIEVDTSAKDTGGNVLGKQFVFFFKDN